MTVPGSCGSGRHRVILAWEIETETMALVCTTCARAVISGDESQGPLLWDLMKTMNCGEGMNGDG